MANFVVARLLQSIVVLFVISVMAFALVLLSGDPVTMMMPIHASDADRQVLRHELGLDQPVPVQYALFVGHALTGDFGQSIKFNQAVLPLIASKLPLTLILATASILLAIVIGVPLGVATGVREGSTLDTLSTILALLTISLPSFWIALMLILLLGDGLRILPVGGSGGPQYLIMPTLALSAHSIGLVTRLTRAGVAEQMHQLYVTTARSKGLTERAIQLRHVLRNASGPTVTMIALQFGALIGGSVIVETIFAWPGAGWLLMEGVTARDLPLVRALVLVIGSIFIGLNLLVDLGYRYLDPRIRY
ncbi:MAG TPA: ABC transporter permease [Chloroflexota bacterium]|nr:ABC transporter permease [Chloroflexota bacterium]